MFKGGGGGSMGYRSVIVKCGGGVRELGVGISVSRRGCGDGVAGRGRGYFGGMVDRKLVRKHW